MKAMYKLLDTRLRSDNQDELLRTFMRAMPGWKLKTKYAFWAKAHLLNNTIHYRAERDAVAAPAHKHAADMKASYSAQTRHEG